MGIARRQQFAAVVILIICVCLGEGCHNSQSPPDNYQRPAYILLPTEVGRFKRGNENYAWETPWTYTYRYFGNSAPCYVSVSASSLDSAEKAEARMRELKTMFETYGFEVVEGTKMKGKDVVGVRLEVRGLKPGSDTLQIFWNYGPVIFTLDGEIHGRYKEQRANRCMQDVLEFEDIFSYWDAVEFNASRGQDA